VGIHPRQRLLAIALLLSLLLWNLPFGGILFYPFKLFATWLHESSHAVVMLLTGAGFDHMSIFRDTSGLAYAESGVSGVGRAAIAAAGYMGTPVFGSIFLILAQDDRAARRVLGALALTMAVSAGCFLSNDFGVAATAIGAAAALVMALVPARGGAAFVLTFIGAQACVNALLDIRVLFRSNLVVDGRVMGLSDAEAMASATFGHTERWAVWLWSGVWLAWSLVLFFVALRVLHLKQARQQRAATAPAL
jgi:peptidase M50B-like protein